MNYKGEIISAIIALGVAVITGIFTARQTYRGEVKKSIHEEREKLYVELLAMLDKLQRNPSIIYNFTEFISTYKQIYARSNLYASGKVMHIIQPFNEKLNEYWNLHEKIYSDEQLEKKYK